MTQLENVNKSNHKTGLDLAKSIAGYTTGYGIAVRAAQSVLSTTTDLVATSVKLAAAQERVRMEFAVLTGSMATGNKIFADMNKLAAQTPLELENITAAGKQLLSVGVPVGEITEKLRMLGDVAMGNPEKLDRLTLAFGQLRSKGVASMEQLNRFIEAGVPIMAELGKQTGKSGEEVFKLVSAGKIGFKDVELALKNMTSEGGLYNDMMKKVAETAEGKFSTAMDNAKLQLAEMGKNVLPLATRALDQFNEAMGYISDAKNLKDALANIKTADYEQAVKSQNKLLETMRIMGTYNDKDVEKARLNLKILESRLRVQQEAAGKEAELASKATERAAAVAASEKAMADAKIIAEEASAIAAEKAGQIAQYWNDVEYTAQLQAAEATRSAIDEADEQVLAQQRLGEGVRESTEAVTIGSLAWQDWNVRLMEVELSTQAVGKAISDGLTNTFTEFGEALSSGEDPAKAFFGTLISSIGNAVIAFGSLAEAQAWASWPIVDIPKAVKGAAIITGGAAIKASAYAMAEGGSGIVTKPTLFLAGEAGPEPFAFGGANNKRGMGMGTTVVNTVNQYIGGSVIAERQVKSLAMSGMAQAARGY